MSAPLILGPGLATGLGFVHESLPGVVLACKPAEANTAEAPDLDLDQFEQSLNRIAGIWGALNKTELKRRTLSRKRFRHWFRQYWPRTFADC